MAGRKQGNRKGSNTDSAAVGTRDIIDLASLLREAANRFITEGLEKRDIKGIVPAHGQVLVPLMHANGPLPLGEIAVAGRRAKSTITGMAATLEKNGYISRRTSNKDGRSVLAELTPEGKALYPAFREISAELIEVLYKGISKEDQHTTVRVLKEGLKNLSS